MAPRKTLKKSEHRSTRGSDTPSQLEMTAAPSVHAPNQTKRAPMRRSRALKLGHLASHSAHLPQTAAQPASHTKLTPLCGQVTKP